MLYIKINSQWILLIYRAVYEQTENSRKQNKQQNLGENIYDLGLAKISW